MAIGIIIGTLMIVCLIYTILKGEYRKEQMTGKESRVLKCYRSMKEKIKDFWSKLPLDSKVVYILLVVGILAVIWFCGIKGNNQENFYYKEKATVAMADTTRKDVITIRLPKKPNVPIRGINVIKGKIMNNES